MTTIPIELRAAAVRREQLRAHARDLGIDGALVYSRRRSAVTWLSGYTPGFISHSAALWVPTEGETVLGVTFPFEVDRARQAGLRTVAIDSPVDLLPERASSIGLLCRDLVVDEATPELFQQLAARGVRHVDLASWAAEAREVKTPEEVTALTAAARIGDLALRAATASPGETDYVVAARVEAAARAAGAHRCLCLVGFGNGSFVTEATGQRLEAGQVVGLEVSLYAFGCFMHVNTTLPPMPAQETVTDAVGLCRSARAAILESLTPGTGVDDVVKAGDAVLSQHGLLRFKEYDFGHGLGCDTPEYPRLIPGTGRTVRSGAVLAVHVMLRRPGGETAMLGGPVVVEPAGARELLPEAVWADPH
ncbi:hypothetical protein GCM10023205_79270 [Yinghuangia aomiensis]|uniref:Xaa-Pro aminopeptidase n=1 Tax=Yinghuangia aomiensis TaxID=676205 RepID=A0ABP9IEU1_9ACTN